MTKQQKHWNLFASELEAILAAHGQSLDNLDPRLEISEEKAQRLRRSLLTAGSFPLLNPEELENLELALSLGSAEWARLQAALQATVVERLLMDRVGLENALQVAEQIVAPLDQALRKQLQQSGMNRIPDNEPEENAEIDWAWERIWDVLDSATAAQQLSRNVSSRERVRRLKEARADFQEAMDELNRLDGDIQSLSLWRQCMQEARQGLDWAVERLKDLGEA